MATISIGDDDARYRVTLAVTKYTTQIPITFPFFDLDDVKVIRTLNGVDQVFTRGTVTSNHADNAYVFEVLATAVDDGYSGGNIRVSETNTSPQPTYTIYRDIPVARTIDFPTSGVFNVNALNTEVDKLWAAMQQLETEVGRSVRMIKTDADSLAITLPSSADRSGEYLYFDAGGNLTTRLDGASAVMNPTYTSLYLEGSTSNEYELQIVATDPTADNVWTIPDSTDTFVGLTGSQTLTNKTLTDPVINGNITGTALQNDPNFASTSPNKIASSQSVKAYVDAQVDTKDALAELDDVAVTGGNQPNNNEFLGYDSSSGKWTSKTASEIGVMPTTGGTFTDDVTFGGTYSAFWDKSEGAFEIKDGAYFHVGDGGPFRIWHDFNTTRVTNSTGNLTIAGSGNSAGEIRIQNRINYDGIIVKRDGSIDSIVELYYDDSLKFETTSSGVKTTGTLDINGAYSLPTSIGSSGQILQVPSSGTELEFFDNPAPVYGKSDTNSLKLEENTVTNDVLLMGTNHVKGKTYAEFKTDIGLNNVENTALSTWAGSSNITTVGTLGQDLTIKTNDGAILTLQTSDTSVEIGDSLGEIHFQAPDEADGVPENLVAGKIIHRAKTYDFGEFPANEAITNAILTEWDFQAFAGFFESTTEPVSVLTASTSKVHAKAEMEVDGKLQADGDITILTSSPTLYIQDTDSSINNGDIVGSIQVSAPNETLGTQEGAVNANTTAKIDVRATTTFNQNSNSSEFDFYLHNNYTISDALTKVANLDNLGLLRLYTPLPTGTVPNSSAGVNFFRTGSDNNARLGSLRFYGDTDTGAINSYAHIKTEILDSSNSDPKGIMTFEVDQATFEGNLKIANTDTSIVADQSIGKIEWQAPDEASADVSDDVTAKIDVVAVTDFGTGTNKSKFEFHIHEDEVAGESLNKVFEINSYGRVSLFGNIPTNVSGNSDPWFSFIRGGGGSGDEVGSIFWKADTNTGSQIEFASIRGKTLDDGTGGSVTGSLHFDLAGQSEVLKLEPTTATLASNLTVSSDTDATTTLGRALIHSPTSDSAVFSHIDKTAISDYALLQNSSGTTYINASSGTTINFNNNNSNVASISSSGLKLNTGKYVTFEGATDDDFETFLTVEDPTVSDKTITLPNATGTVALATPNILAGNLLLNTTISDVATVEVGSTYITDDYDYYDVLLYDIIPETDARYLMCRLGVGGSVSSGGSDYSYGIYNNGAKSTDNVQYANNYDGTSTGMLLTASFDIGELGNGTGEAYNGHYRFHNLRSTNYYKRLSHIDGFYYSANEYHVTTRNGLSYGAYNINRTSKVDTIQFLMESGNLASGTMSLYGWKK